MMNILVWDNITPTDSAMFEKHFEPVAECTVLPESTSLEELMVAAGVFKSRNDSRKNGFSGPIPEGCNLLGTKKNKFWCWKRTSK